MVDQSEACGRCQISRLRCSLLTDEVRPFTSQSSTACSYCRSHNYECVINGDAMDILAMFSPELDLSRTVNFGATKLSVAGSFGMVYKYDIKCDNTSNKRVVAVKVPFHRKDSAVRTAREALVWAGLQHQNIMLLRGLVVDPRTDNLCLVSDWMVQGNVMEYVSRSPWIPKLPVLAGIARGVEYMHSLRPPVVHGDLKGNNVLISKDGEPKITDFGLSYIYMDGEHHRDAGSSSILAVNARWAAAEVLIPATFGIAQNMCRQPASDVFSLSRLILEVLTEAHPFPEECNSLSLVTRVHRGEQPRRPPRGILHPIYDDFLWDLMTWGWAHHPSDRVDAAFIANILDRLSRAPRMEQDEWESVALEAAKHRRQCCLWLLSWLWSGM